MLMRRINSYYFNHGVQYFTVKTKQFKNFIESLISQGVIKHCNARYVKFKGQQIVERKNWSHHHRPRYVGNPSMNQVAKYLAKDFDIHLNTKIIYLNHQYIWQLVDKKGQEYHGFNLVILYNFIFISLQNFFYIFQ